MNQLILGDNLEIMKNMDSESIDLIYLDPPFFSNRTYEVIWGDKGEVRSFEDRFSGGIDHYIAWLKERVEEMHRLLKPTGSIFLHCDWHANAYIRVMILDKIFGQQNFHAEIIWKRANTIKGNFGQGAKFFDSNTDTIFFYSKTDNYTFNQIFKPYTKEYLDEFYKYTEPKTKRKYRLISMIGPGGAAKGNPEYEVMGVTKYWRYSKAKMEEFIKQGLIVQTSPGTVPQKKQYLDEGRGVAVQNLWDDIDALAASSKDRIGYPTQKPYKLLERIILAATNEGDLVMDPFVGGGTTIVVADKLQRNWIGIDQSVQAIKVSEMRINSQQDMFSKDYFVKLHKYDYDTLRNKDAFQFETFIVEQYGGIPNKKQRGDSGIDGKARDGSPIQVKRSDAIGRNVVDNFFSAAQRFDKKLLEKNKAEKIPIGTIIAFSFSKEAIQEVARLKNHEDVIIKLLKVEDIIPISKKPQLELHIRDMSIGQHVPTDKPMFEGMREIEFCAKGKSAAGIEFYSWDWDYEEKSKIFKPEVFVDKEGVQIRKMQPGKYVIAVKAIDNDGLEAIEVIRLKINGKVVQEKIQ